MPDSQLPPWGPAYDERDLDGLLSGETASLPEALIPVAGTLAALRARPVAAELAGEAAARAAFRRFAPGASHGAGDSEYGLVPSHTLVLPRAAEGRPQRHTPRHRRRARRGAFGRPKTIVGMAAGLVLVAGVAIAATLPGAVKPESRDSAEPAASPTVTGPAAHAQSPLGTGTPAILATPAPGATSNPGELCREFYDFFSQREPDSAWTAEEKVLGKLDKLAGNPWKVLSYCLPYVGYQSWGTHPPTVTFPRGKPWPLQDGDAGDSGNGLGGQQGNGNDGQNGNPGNAPGSGQQGHGQKGLHGSTSRQDNQA